MIIIFFPIEITSIIFAGVASEIWVSLFVHLALVRNDDFMIFDSPLAIVSTSGFSGIAFLIRGRFLFMLCVNIF